MHHVQGRPGLRSVSASRAAVLGALCAFSVAFAEESKPAAARTDLTAYYQYPFSVGFQYLGANFVSPTEDHEAYDLSAQARLPLPFMPAVALTLAGGLTEYLPADAASRWAHRDYFSLAGAGWAKRVSKNLEFGAEALAGASLSRFEDLVPDGEPVANRSLLAQASARVAFLPSYHFALEATPTVRYALPIDAIDGFAGFRAGVSLSAHFRLGDDPDADAGAVRSLRLLEGRLPPAFPAMQSWYTKNPLATVSLQNVEKAALEDVEISFMQKNYMDSPTPCVTIGRIGPGETALAPILASFNEAVFRNEGVTPLSGEIIAKFTVRGRAREQRITVGFDLQDRGALVWDDDRKAAAFITPVDGAIRNYASHIRQIFKDRTVTGYNEQVQYACQLFYALGQIGILYQADPLQSFASVQGNDVSVDSINLPRDTLKRVTGDCDDLTVLFASMLETVGIETALITVPGHIYVAFNTKMPGASWQDVHSDRSMTVNAEGELWVPFEVTLIGKGTFLAAWRKGAEEWAAQETTPGNRGFYPVRRAQDAYRPIGLRETDLGLQYGDSGPVLSGATRELNDLVASIVAKFEDDAKRAATKEQINRLGIRLAKFGRHDAAIKAFDRALALDKTYASPRMNIANTFYLMKNYGQALAEYKKLEAALPSGDERTLSALKSNMARCSEALGAVPSGSAAMASADGTQEGAASRTERAANESAQIELIFGE